MSTWACEDCGWECAPNPDVPLDEAECDNCGGELALVSDEPARDIAEDLGDQYYDIENGQ